MLALLHQAAMLEHQNIVGFLNSGQAVCNASVCRAADSVRLLRLGLCRAQAAAMQAIISSAK
jgi:hypothetical protein